MAEHTEGEFDMHEISRVRAVCCATRIPAEQADGPFRALTDDELRDAEEVLRQEILRRIGNIMAALDPHDLTLEECCDLFKLLRSIIARRRGSRA
jgi:hypothetical protein